MPKFLNNDNMRWFMTVAFGAMIALTLNNWTTASPPPNAALKIGIVDLGVLFNQYKSKTALEVEIQKRKEQVETEIENLTKKMRKMNDELEDYKGEKLQEKRLEIEMLLHKRELLGKLYKARLSQEMADKTVVLLDKINDTIRKYGKKNGYTVILKIDNEGFGKEQFREKIFRAQVQSILFHDSAIDLTQAILKILNK